MTGQSWSTVRACSWLHVVTRRYTSLYVVCILICAMVVTMLWRLTRVCASDQREPRSKAVGGRQILVLDSESQLYKIVYIAISVSYHLPLPVSSSVGACFASAIPLGRICSSIPRRSSCREPFAALHTILRWCRVRRRYSGLHPTDLFGLGWTSPHKQRQRAWPCLAATRVG